MADSRHEAGPSPSYEELLAHNERLTDENERLVVRVTDLEERLVEMERRFSQNSGNSGKPSSRDPAAERDRQAEVRRQRTAKTSAKRSKGKQSGSKGTTLQMSPHPDEIVDHRPDHCGKCSGALDASADKGYRARQVIEVPAVEPTTTEHRSHTYGCACGHDTTEPFPDNVRERPSATGREPGRSWPTCSGASTSPTAGCPRRWPTCSACRYRPGPSTRSTPRRAGASAASSPSS